MLHVQQHQFKTLTFRGWRLQLVPSRFWFQVRTPEEHFVTYLALLRSSLSDQSWGVRSAAVRRAGRRLQLSVSGAGWSFNQHGGGLFVRHVTFSSGPPPADGMGCSKEMISLIQTQMVLIQTPGAPLYHAEELQVKRVKGHPLLTFIRVNRFTTGLVSTTGRA